MTVEISWLKLFECFFWSATYIMSLNRFVAQHNGLFFLTRRRSASSNAHNALLLARFHFRWSFRFSLFPIFSFVPPPLTIVFVLKLPQLRVSTFPPSSFFFRWENAVTSASLWFFMFEKVWGDWIDKDVETNFPRYKRTSTGKRKKKRKNTIFFPYKPHHLEHDSCLAATCFATFQCVKSAVVNKEEKKGSEIRRKKKVTTTHITAPNVRKKHSLRRLGWARPAPS